MKRKFIHPSVDSCKCRHDIMTAAAAPVHFDLDMKLCSGLSLCPSLRTTIANTWLDNVTLPPPQLGSGLMGGQLPRGYPFPLETFLLAKVSYLGNG